MNVMCVNDRGVINATLVRLFQFSCTHGCTMVSLVQFDAYKKIETIEPALR